MHNMDPPSVAPDNSAALSTLKRKRSPSSNAPGGPRGPGVRLEPQAYLDILDSLRRYLFLSTTVALSNVDHFDRFDKLRTVLNHPITPKPDSKDTDAPSSKRVKFTDLDSIAKRLQSDYYYTDANFFDVMEDIRGVVDAIVEPIKATLPRFDRSKPPSDDLLEVRRIDMFGMKAHNLLRRKLMAHFKKIREEGAEGMLPSQPPARTVLTLFGNAPTPKQLFSSLQHPTDSTHSDLEPVDLDLEQLGLPNMLNATKVFPLNPDAAQGARPRQPTFADVFPPPANLPPLIPPKPKSTARSASISWVTKDTALPKPSRKNAYTMQPLIVGSWLDYGARDADRESSGTIKRRRRESIVNSAPQPKPIEDMSPEELLAQEQALFTAAYSTFAPPIDNSKAIVSNDIRDRVWWHKLGHERFDKRFVLDPTLDGSFPYSVDSDHAMDDEPVTSDSTDEMKAFEEAVLNFDEDDFNNADHLVIDINDEERTTEQMLIDISALIETLSSYQRLRSSTIASAPSSRNPTSPSPALTSLIGTPTEPTKDEITIYKALRSQLAQLISKLPPYAVAKLDGEQLEDLIVSKTITVQGKEYRGTMEEDQLTRMIKSSAAVQAAAGSTSTARSTNDYKSSSSYSRSASLAQPPRSAQASTPGYYAGARTPAAAFNRSTIAPQNYSTPTATGSQRQSYSTASGYPATAPRPSTYNQQANGQQPGYRSGYNYGSAFNTQPPTPQQSTQTPAAAHQQSQPQFRNPTPQHAQNSAAAGGYTPRPASYNAIQPPQQYSAQQQQQQQQRPNGQPPQGQPATAGQQHSTSGRATPTQQTPMQTPSSSSAVASMTSEQHQMMMMMERQRAQLTQQPVARASAQTTEIGEQRPGGVVSASSAPVASGLVAGPVAGSTHAHPHGHGHGHGGAPTSVVTPSAHVAGVQQQQQIQQQGGQQGMSSQQGGGQQIPPRQAASQQNGHTGQQNGSAER